MEPGNQTLSSLPSVDMLKMILTSSFTELLCCMKKHFLFIVSLVFCAVLSTLLSPSVFAQEASPEPTVSPLPSCVRSGCSGELCVPAGSEVSTTCIFKPEFACLQQANCERNEAGNCAFTITPQVQACLDQANPSVSPSPSPSATPSPSPSPSPTTSPADINGDGRVNLLDYAILVNELFQTGPNLQADINGDGKVNLLDYHILLVNLST